MNKRYVYKSEPIHRRSDAKKEFRPSQDKDFEANIPRIANNGTKGPLKKKQIALLQELQSAGISFGNNSKELTLITL